MKKILTLFFVAMMLNNISLAQKKQLIPDSPEEKKLEYFYLRKKKGFKPNDFLNQKLEQYEAFNFNIKKLSNYLQSDKYGKQFILKFPHKEYNLSLQPSQLKSVNYTSVLNGELREKKQKSISREPITNFKGFTNGNINNIVRLSVFGNQMSGSIYNEKEDSWIFFDSYQILMRESFNKDKSKENILIVYDASKIVSKNICKVENKQKEKDTSKNGRNPPIPINNSFLCKHRTLEIATEADYEMFQIYGSAIGDVILTDINRADGIFTRYFNLNLVLSFQKFWTTPEDPYNYLNLAYPSNNWEPNRFDEFISQYSTQGSPNYNVNRDASILYTGAAVIWDTVSSNLSGGIARFNGACSLLGYAVTAGLANHGDPLTTTHEIAHLLGSNHDYNTSSCGIMCAGPNQSGSGPYFSNKNINEIFGAIPHKQCLSNLPINNQQDWLKAWSNENNYPPSFIGPWYMRDEDKELVGDFDNDGDEELLLINSNTGYATILNYSCSSGTKWYTMWSNRGRGKFLGKPILPGNKYITGDFNGNGFSEVLYISQNNGLAMLKERNHFWQNLSYSFLPFWKKKWSNKGNGKISKDWNINVNKDIFLVGNFIPERNYTKDELLIIRPKGINQLTSKAILLKFNGTVFQKIWESDLSNPTLGFGTINRSSNYLVDNFYAAYSEQLLVFHNKKWVYISAFDPNTLSWRLGWNETQVGKFAGFKRTPPITDGKRYVLSGNFDADAKAEVINLDSKLAFSADFNYPHGFLSYWNKLEGNLTLGWPLNPYNNNESKYFSINPIGGYKDYLFVINSNPFSRKAAMFAANNYSIVNMKVSDNKNQINSVNKEEVLIYPNPTNNNLVHINIKTIISNNFLIEIYDLQGKRVKKLVTNNSKNNIVLDVVPGLYIVQIKTNNKIYSIKKLVIK